MSAVSTAYIDTHFVSGYLPLQLHCSHPPGVVSVVNPLGHETAQSFIGQTGSNKQADVKKLLHTVQCSGGSKISKGGANPNSFSHWFWLSFGVNEPLQNKTWTLNIKALFTSNILACFFSGTFDLFFTFCNVMCEDRYRNSFNQFRSSEKNDAKKRYV